MHVEIITRHIFNSFFFISLLIVRFAMGYYFLFVKLQISLMATKTKVVIPLLSLFSISLNIVSLYLQVHYELVCGDTKTFADADTTDTTNGRCFGAYSPACSDAIAYDAFPCLGADTPASSEVIAYDAFPCLDAVSPASSDAAQ